ncbi:hypothetical protein AMAG_16319 [Allomyces macrogynus ATCC 38327]|uniref:Dolichol-phosphate mannosyltransferase subunit 3 n=1 Tax=Allomyces macrogynus (strain ATCC 38327) TaxID=578462 RepID=A0A0L0TAZ6_ALLM3|nr:hypothetical protein AMAG_16319 [Allomyces macrogynus ATCC 38327]|eukprot:KNE71891.1 hypothetical protein AMAG_16319 [Allomyces macrogynus ATCC 38327]
MSKLTRFLATAFGFLAVWLATLLGYVPVPEIAMEFVPALPLWIIVSFGAYSLASIGWSLVTFGDCPEAHQELLQEIQQAKADLRRLKVTVD